MPYALAPSVSFCEPDAQRIFLDLAADRYFSLGAAADRAFTRLINSEPLDSDDRDRLDILSRSGVLRHVSAARDIAPCVAPSLSAAALDLPGLPRAPVLPTIAAAVRLSRAKRRLARMPLGRLCDRFVAEKSRIQGRRDAPGDTPLRLAAAFQAAARLVGALDQCLALSLALGHRALAAGLAVELVFGVRGRPFHAHAWIQLDGVALTDRLDNIRPYTPIRIL